MRQRTGFTGAKMGKGRMQRGEKEFEKIEKLKHENQRLRRELSALRKKLGRTDINKLEHLETLVSKQRSEQKKIESKKQDDTKWLCHQCGKGHMKIFIFSRRDGVFYNRSCDNTECGNRTKMKKFHDGVEES